MSAGRWDEAERELRSELAIQPRYARAYRNLAIVLRHEGRDEEAGVAEMHADALVAP
jgi:Flp pilus assembly protein TadD